MSEYLKDRDKTINNSKYLSSDTHYEGCHNISTRNIITRSNTHTARFIGIYIYIQNSRPSSLNALLEHSIAP